MKAIISDDSIAWLADGINYEFLADGTQRLRERVTDVLISAGVTEREGEPRSAHPGLPPYYVLAAYGLDGDERGAIENAAEMALRAIGDHDMVYWRVRPELWGSKAIKGHGHLYGYYMRVIHTNVVAATPKGSEYRQEMIDQAVRATFPMSLRFIRLNRESEVFERRIEALAQIGAETIRERFSALQQKGKSS